METVNELNGKIWYRTVKVIYGAVSLLILASGLYHLFQENVYYEDFETKLYEGTIFAMMIFTLIVILIYETIRRAFYYIVFRKLFPKKK